MKSNKVAMVTGAGRGIGAATAKLLALEGYAVAVNYQSSRDAAEAVVRDIESAGGTARAFRADVGREPEILKLFEAVDSAFGPVSALVNNAAINMRNGDGSVEQALWQDWEATFAVNVFGAMACCREALKRMKAGGGAIVNVTSEAARFGGNRMTAYASSKAAVQTFTVGFAREAAPLGVRVNAVSPGVIDTEAHAGIPAERLQALKSSVPAGRLGVPEEVAAAIAWLLSDKACYVSGAVLSVTGAR